MTERPILFNAEMVRAVLDGRKTQTRRVIKGDPSSIRWCPIQLNRYDGWEDNHGRPYPCPYGKVGDELWVRETFLGLHETEFDEVSGGSIDHGSDLSLGKEYHSGIDYVASGSAKKPPALHSLQTINIPGDLDIPGDWWLAPPDGWDGYDEEDHKNRGQWEFLAWELYTKHPSIHMPRWASRIQLKIKDIRVERVQDISYQGAIDEGLEKEWDGTAHWYKDYSTHAVSWWKQNPKGSFHTLWDSINAKRGYGWEANPWVWVVEFEVIERAA